MRWLLHRSPWLPSSYSDIPNGTEDLPQILEELMNETDQQHLIFKLTPRKVFDGSVSVLDSQRSQRRKKRHLLRETDSRSRDNSKHGRRKRDVMVKMPQRTVETLVVIDKMMLAYHKSKELLQPYVLTIMNIVSSATVRNNYDIIFAFHCILPQTALRRDCNGKCIEMNRGSLLIGRGRSLVSLDMLDETQHFICLYFSWTSALTRMNTIKHA